MNTSLLKTSFEQLSINGGEPAFAHRIHVGTPNIGNRASLYARIDHALTSRRLSNNGPYVRQLEECLQDLTGAQHCIATCNATIALEIAAKAIGLVGQVIVPSFTFIATAHSLSWLGLQPVFCDIGEDHLIRPDLIEALITPRTSGIVGVHLWGSACDVTSLQAIANAHSLKLLFDASHAFGCTYNGKSIGRFGEAEIFSFHATKVVNGFEGGAITTNNADLAARIRQIRNFGLDDSDVAEMVGTNAKMHEVSAAMLLTSLEAMDSFIQVNKSNYDLYCKYLSSVPQVRLLRPPSAERSNYHYVVCEVSDHTGHHSTRDRLLHVLHSENIWARRYFYPGCHHMTPYRSRVATHSCILPHTDLVSSKVLVLPTGSSVKAEDIEAICAIIRIALENIDRLMGESGC